MFGSSESAWFMAAAGVALKSTAVMSAAWVMTFLLRRRSAAMRHLVWTAAAVAVVLLPFLSVSLPALPVRAGAAFLPQISVLVVAQGTTRTASWTSIHDAGGHSAAAARPALVPDWRILLALFWGLGAAAALAQTAMSFARMQRIRKTAKPSPDGAAARELARRLEIEHTVDVLETAEGSMPMAFGILRPAVLIPSSAAEWSEERRRVVLLHELAHVRRGDLVTHMVARLALALNWWNPLAWVAWREFLKESERAADDLVLRAGASAPEYAGHLLAVARTMQTTAAQGAAALAMARRSELEGRLMAILDTRVNRKSTGRKAVLVAALLGVGVVAPIAALKAQDAASQAVPADVEATIKAAQAQKNYEMLDGPAAALSAARQYQLAQKVLEAGAAIREQVAGSNSVEYGAGLIKLGDLEMKQNRFENAEVLYNRAASMMGDKPEAARALTKLGVIMLHKKNPEAAMDYFQRAQRVNPSDSGPAWTWMAVASRDNPSQAEANFRSALAVEKPDSAAAATTLELFADLLKSQGRDGEAQPLLERARAIRSAGAPKRAVAAGVYKIGGAVAAPKLISKAEPEYTEEARLAKYQGTAVLFVEIGPDGIAHNIQIARGLGMGLDENAVAAVSTWRFQPGTKGGSAVPVIATIEVNFRLM